MTIGNCINVLGIIAVGIEVLLLIFLGLAIHSNHPVGIIALTLPVFSAISIRIRIEERAMESYFGVEYAEYRKRTKKLIPHVY